ncbi:MAG: hypothetical protein E7447_05340 [Ruminococcaceae bacterium]|nr:hypothetical protein [Oscillospiraceae bacterium]
MEYENENNEQVRRVTRQSWKPSDPVQILQGFWKGAYTVLKIVLGAIATVLVMIAVCVFVFVGLLADYLDSDEIMGNAEVVMGDFDQSGNSVMYYTDEDGNIQVLQRLHADVDEDWATYDEIPEALVYAAVAIEDHRFFEHQGVDWIPTIKACISMFVGGREFGGSSITQQLIKNLYLEYDSSADDVTVQRKVLEIFRATEFEKRYNKEFIMEWYLNKIYLGERCKGVKPAAAEYFGKELEDLNVAECAALISITNNPSLFNPYREGLDNYKGEQLTGMERNKRRREDTIFMMHEYGWLTDEEYEQALIDSANLTLKRGLDDEDRYGDCIYEDCAYHGKLGTFITKEDGKIYCPVCDRATTVGNDASREVYSWFVDVVLEEVAQYYCERAGLDWETSDKDTKQDFKRMVCQSGLHIYTTLDMTVQKQLDKIYTNLDEIPDTDSIQQLQSGMVIIDNETGDIVAIAGGVGEKDVHDAYSKATDSKLQPGSSIKPLTVYAPAFELGVLNPASVVEDLPFYYVNENPFPRNSNRKYSMARSILTAVEDSVNAVAIKCLDIMGREYAFNFAKDKFGLSTLVKETMINGKLFTDVDWAPLGLGAPTKGVTVRAMANAYATFANNGVYRNARTYTLIYDHEGHLVHKNDQNSERILSYKTVDYINYCLEAVVQNGTGTTAKFKGFSYDIYGKTGTTTSAKDRWFCGYTNRYTAAVWTGYNHPEAITGVSGGNVACQLWRKVMEPLHVGTASKPLYNPSHFVSVQICSDCGSLATEACLQDVRTYEHGLKRVEEVLVYPEDAPTTTCTCHVLVDFCLDCNAAAHDGCHNIVKRALVKMTQTKVNEIIKAAECGLQEEYLGENYIYLVDNFGNPVAFFGFKGDKNLGLNYPYLVCDIHKPKGKPVNKAS